MKAVIFAGGVGTRLWPLSRKKSPKQFEKIVGDKSTLQLAAERLLPDFSWSDIYVSTGKSYAELVAKQLPEMSPSHVISEPLMRDVGPAVGLVTALLNTESPDEPMVILWSDHLVKKDKLFRKILITAGKEIEKNPNQIIFVSQKPRFASVNLGWINYGKQAIKTDDVIFHHFVGFQYRPDEKTAENYFTSGHHAWNLGYFVTTPRYLLEQYKKFVPNMYKSLDQIASNYRSERYDDVLESLYPKLEKISFDNAILEKLDPSQAKVVSDNIEWSDIGAWEALKEALEETEDKNVVQGSVILRDTTDSLVYNYTNQTVCAIDASDMLIINTGDVVLVCKKTSVPKIKKLVESLAGTDKDHLT